MMVANEFPFAFEAVKVLLGTDVGGNRDVAVGVQHEKLCVAESEGIEVFRLRQWLW